MYTLLVLVLLVLRVGKMQKAMAADWLEEERVLGALCWWWWGVVVVGGERGERVAKTCTARRGSDG